MRLTLVLTLLAALALPAGASAAIPRIFPSDKKFTVKDTRQVTGRRVRLRGPSCRARPSDCNDRKLLNRLDGFDLDPRIEVRFDNRVDVSKVTPRTFYVQSVGGGARIGVNRVVFSPARNALYAQPRDLLLESTRYRIVVGKAIGGRRATARFTTMTATSPLRRMRGQLDDGSAYDAAGIPADQRGLDFVRPDGLRTVFPAAGVLRIRRFNDVGRAPLEEEVVPNTALRNAGLYGFGSFLAPSWLNGSRVISQVPTGQAPRVRGREEVGFTVIVPSGAKPAGGWPVAIFGPGITRSKYDLFLAADENASRGVATLSIDPAGHAFGPGSEAAVDSLTAGSVRFSGFGRGVDLDSDGEISNQEGVQAPGSPDPRASLGLRDGLRQTALDNMALVRAIARGVDVDGDGSVDLRRDRVSYYAQSLGGIYGTMLMGTDQLVGAGLLNVPGGPILDIARLAPGFRDLVAAELGNRRPSLLNGGREGFTESQPMYTDPPVTAPARGAVPIQDVGAASNWLNRPGSPEAFAPLLRLRPAAGVPAKRVAYQIAFGDKTVPNPTSATLLRAGKLFDVTTFYRNDRTPSASLDPHGFLLDPRITGRNLGQLQAVEFLATEGRSIIDPDGGANVFETPVADPATMDKLNYPLADAQEPPPEAAVAGLRLSVVPRRVRAGRQVRISFRVTTANSGRRRAVKRAVVRLAGRQVRTNSRGRASMRVRFRRRGAREAVAKRRGLRAARATVRVLRAQPRS